jgi:hypothetical protein
MPNHGSAGRAGVWGCKGNLARAGALHELIDPADGRVLPGERVDPVEWMRRRGERPPSLWFTV